MPIRSTAKRASPCCTRPWWGCCWGTGWWRGSGAFEELEPLDIASADALLAEAIDAAGRDAGVAWRGQVFAVEGDPDVIARANDASDEE